MNWTDERPATQQDIAMYGGNNPFPELKVGRFQILTAMAATVANPRYDTTKAEKENVNEAGYRIPARLIYIKCTCADGVDRRITPWHLTRKSSELPGCDEGMDAIELATKLNGRTIDVLEETVDVQTMNKGSKPRHKWVFVA